jgi:hypothetical protein
VNNGLPIPGDSDRSMAMVVPSRGVVVDVGGAVGLVEWSRSRARSRRPRPSLEYGGKKCYGGKRRRERKLITAGTGGNMAGRKQRRPVSPQDEAAMRPSLTSIIQLEGDEGRRVTEDEDYIEDEDNIVATKIGIEAHHQRKLIPLSM